MECVMLWHGGASYASFDAERDGEHFPSIAAAMRAFERRQWDSYYPCVYSDTPENGGPEAWLIFANERTWATIKGSGDLYPDRTLAFGPRGGIRMERV